MEVTGKVLLLAEDHERVAIKSFRNLGDVIASNLGQANTYDVLWADTIIMSRGTLDLGQSVPRGTEEHAAQAIGAAVATAESVDSPDSANSPESVDSPESADSPESVDTPDGGES